MEWKNCWVTLKTPVLIGILAISAIIGFGASQWAESAGTVSIGTEGDFCIPGDLTRSQCGGIGDNCYCADSIATCLCGEVFPQPSGNFTLTNISKNPILLNEIIVEVDSEPTIKGIQPFVTSLEVPLLPDEIFQTPIPYGDSEGNKLDYSKSFDVIVSAEIIEDKPRGGDSDPKVKEVKVKKKIGSKK